MINIQSIVRNRVVPTYLRQLTPLKNKNKLISTNTYTYISPIDKPVLSLALTSFHEMCADLMMYSYVQSQMIVSPQFSIVLGAIVFRLGLQGYSAIIKSFDYHNKNSLQTRDYVAERSADNDRFLIKWIDKILILDSVRDLQFYGVVKQDINKAMYQYYRPSVLISSTINMYLCLNFLRGSNLLITNPQCQQFCQSTVYLINLSLYDPKYITPIAIILLNFLILKKSRHPIFININHPGNLMHCINLSFMTGLIFVPLPGVFHFSYIGLALGHLGIRFFQYWKSDIFRGFRRLRSFRK